MKVEGCYMSDNNLEVSNLELQYPNNGFHLNPINFVLPKGKVVGLIGENGSGKTTTMNLILNLRKKTAGDVKIFNQAFKEDDVAIKERIGVSFDEIVLPMSLNATDVSTLYRSLYKKWDSQYFEQTLAQFGIDSKKRIQEYSKGMQKMFSIVTSMAHKPDVLILDEPTSALDPVRRQEVLGMFRNFIEEQNSSILFSSHITTDIEHIADFVVYINKGHQIFFEPIDKLRNDYPIMKCSHSVFQTISESDIVGSWQHGKEHVVLLKSKEKLARFKDSFVIESPTLEEIMNMFSKGMVI